MGMLGALDPFRHKLLQGGIDDPNAETSGPRVTDITLLMNISTPSNDDYYQTVVVNSLVSVLNDPTMKELHYEAIQAVMLIFRSQQLRSVNFLPQVRTLVSTSTDFRSYLLSSTSSASLRFKGKKYI
jgi:FKBP12-rapamycin complex-associated protein